MLTTRLMLKKSLRHRHGGNLSVTAVTSAQIHHRMMRRRTAGPLQLFLHYGKEEDDSLTRNNNT